MTFRQKKFIVFGTITSLVGISILLAAPASAHAAWTIEPLYKVLKTNTNIKDVWTQVRNMINIVIIAALIFIAFANILRINLNNYAIKKFLPALVAGVILANFSYFICQLFIDLANVAMSLLMNGATGASATNYVGSGKVGVAGAFDFTSYKVEPKFLARSFIYIVFEIIGAIMVFILAILFFVRNYVIYFLVALSPLAMMATVLPETKSVWKQWSSHFFKWTFMPLLSLFWLWVGGLWWASGFSPTGGSGTQAATGSEFNSSLFGVLFAGFCFYLAITSPWKMGGEIMGKWGGLAKNAWNKTGGAAWKATGGAAIKGAKDGVNKWYDTKRKGVINHLETKTRVGRSIATARDKNELNNQIATMKLEKGRSDNFRSLALQKWVQQGAGLKDRDPVAYSRLKKIIGNGVADEAGNPAYKNQKTVKDLRDQLRYYEDENGNTRLASAADMGDWRRLRKVGEDGRLRAVEEREWTKDKGLSMYEEHAASYGELVRRGKSKSNTDFEAVTEFMAGGGLNPTGQPISTRLDARVMASNTVADEEVERRVAEAEIQQERLRISTEAQHQSGISSSIMKRLSDADSFASGLGRDGLSEAMSQLQRINGSAGAGLESLNQPTPDLAAAMKAASEISKDFEVSLKAHESDPTKMAEELGRIFKSTQQEVAKLQAEDLSEELYKFQTDAGSWQQERTHLAHVEGVNSRTAGEVQNMGNASINDLRSMLDNHMEELIQSNEQIQRAIKENPGKLDTNALKTEISQHVNAAIGQKMQTSGNEGDATDRLRKAVAGALVDPNVNKSLARTFQKASEGALKSTPAPRAIDIHPPSTGGPSFNN